MESIASVQTKDYIATQIRELVYQGRLSDGQELTQEDIAARLGVSRMPVREAFQALAQQGVLQRLPNRHMRVIGISSENTVQLISVLSAVQQQVLRFVCEFSEPPTAELMALLESLDEVSWHRRISMSLGNAALDSWLSPMLGGYIAYCMRRYKEPSRIERLVLATDFLEAKASDDACQALRGYFDMLLATVRQGARNG
ncbi:MAG: GntR family transcriptional regulator [Sphaerochaetaceae bacterium]|nr:GntR family transcriptional regulator [Sphaerochaetaceae bacterium]